MASSLIVQEQLRILVVLNLPWDPRLGAARVLIELAEQWKRAGYKVDKYCLTDAFPRATASRRIDVFRQVVFGYRARRFIRENAARFDVIDALIGSMPFPKKSIGFEGLLVARSIGLYLAYEQFIQFSRRRWPDQGGGNFLGSLYYRFLAAWTRRNCERSVANADLINLPIDEERQILQTTSRKPAIVHPYGLSDSEKSSFAAASLFAKQRLERKEICFVGMWSLRKGSRDWPEIVHRIRIQEPKARFLFLGTMTDDRTVLNDLAVGTDDSSIRCLTSYDPKELPGLIGSCAVGIFPSYVEGFGISVLEQLAAGIPTIAYDVPGPRFILRTKAAEFLVSAGDAQALADRALKILRLSDSDYAPLSDECREISAEFRWEKIAADTARDYADVIERIAPSDRVQSQIR